MSGDSGIIGYIGVIDGKPVFESCSDAQGDCKRVEVYNDDSDALARWAHVRRVRIVIDDALVERPTDWGRL